MQNHILFSKSKPFFMKLPIPQSPNPIPKRIYQHLLYYIELKKTIGEFMNKTKFLAAVAATAVASAFAAPEVSLYGLLQFNGAFESGSHGVSGQNYNWKLPSDAGKGEGHYLLNVNSTRIGVNIINAEEGKPQTSGKFEVDFLNDEKRNTNGVSSFRIRHAYGQVKFASLGLTLLMGQSSDLISPITPDMANQGVLQGTGNLGTRRPQIRLTEEVGMFDVAVAVVDDRGATNPKWPATQYRAGVKVPASWAGEKQNIALGVSYHYAHEAEAATEDNAAHVSTAPSYSFNVDAVLPVISIVTLKGEWFMGKDLANYNKGTLGYKAKDLSAGKDGIESMGGWGQLSVKLPADLAFNGGMGVESLGKPKKSVTWKSDDPIATQNLSIFTNVSYNIASNTKLTLEWFRMQTDYAKELTAESIVLEDNDPNKVKSGVTNRVEVALNYGF
jgi:hypothetical protein